MQSGPLGGGKPGYFRRKNLKMADVAHAFSLLESVALRAQEVGFTEAQLHQLNKWHRGAQKRLDGQAGEKAIQSVHAVGTAPEDCLAEVGNARLADEWVVLSAEQEADSDEGLDVFACDKCGREFLDLVAAEAHE